MEYPNLFSELDVGPITVKNRIVSSGHATRLVDEQVIGDRLLAYHEARAAGGVGLIITEASMVDIDSAYSPGQLVNADDGIVPTYQRLADILHSHGCKVFGQLLHLGLEQSHTLDGRRAAAWGPSDSPSERYHTSGRAMSVEMIRDLIAKFGDAAERVKRGGLDGVEIAASHGYLPAQFLSTGINRRTDHYGGSFENRLRFLREILDEVRNRIGPDLAIGVRISGEEMATDGLDRGDVLEACAALSGDGVIDYFNIPIGSSRQIAAAVHIASPMRTDSAISAAFAGAVRSEVSQPVIAVGRIKHPSEAEHVLSSGLADLCGMTRAMICDADMPEKARTGRTSDIRECISCNQACIDHFHRGLGVSCIQHPESGRELQYGLRVRARRERSVVVVGGGPGGMKAAAVAAERGHDVILFEKERQLGGQVLLAERLPGRSEFGGIVPNLQREVESAGVDVRLGSMCDRSMLDEMNPEVVIVATGAVARRPVIEVADGAHVVDAWQVLCGSVEVGRRVVVGDWRCDWVGMGIAEQLRLAGHEVRLASNGHVAGETLPRYVRDYWIGELHRLGVEMIPLVRVFGVDNDTVYLQHMASGDAVYCEGVDTLVTAAGHQSVTDLEESLTEFAGEVLVIGDAAAARTVEEAVLEGLEAASRI